MSGKMSLQGDRNQNIKVYVRCRPINEQEKKARNQLCVDVNENRKAITVKSHHDKTFTFDGTFDKGSNQIDVYKSVVQPLITEVLQGYNCTVFAYGQTGTGKTYTMEGVRTESLLSWQHDPHSGIVPRALHQIFSEVGDTSVTIIKVSFLELYNEELFDLLGSGEQQTSKLKIYEDASAKGSVVVKGLEEVVVRDREEVYALMERGASRRQVAATLMNASSSRSHTIFTITVISKDTSDTGVDLMRTGKLNLVDLAGSENIGRSGAQDKRAREAGNINQSLLTLGRVITALVERTPHVPYRESKLTRLLQDSLGGRTKTSIIATISPAQVNIEETLSTLEYAFRAKNIMNRPEVNQKLCKEVVLKHMTDELEQLRRDLIACREKNGVYIDETNYRTMQNRLDMQSEELQRKAEELTDLNQRMELLQVQIDQVNALFDDSQRKLESESSERQKAQTRLKEVNFNYTAAKLAIQAHRKTEEKLHQDAYKLITTNDLAKSDIGKLHEKVERQQVLEDHNQEVIDRLFSAISSSIDSTRRKAEDAFSDLTKASALTEEAVCSLREEGRLLNESECHLGSLVDAHLRNKAKFIEKLGRIDARANVVLDDFRGQVALANDFAGNAILRVNKSFCTDLITNIRDTKRTLVHNLGQICEIARGQSANAKTINQLCCSDLEKVEKVTQNIRQGVLHDLGRSKASIEILGQETSAILSSMDELRGRLSMTLSSLQEAAAGQDQVAAKTGTLCSEIDSLGKSMKKSVESYVREAGENADYIVDELNCVTKTIVNQEDRQLTKIDAFMTEYNENFSSFDDQMKKIGEETLGHLGDLRTDIVAARDEFTSASSDEVAKMATIGHEILSVKSVITETGAKLLDMKHEVSDTINKDVQRYQKTGSTPARRSYDVPRILPKTQPVNMLQAKLQVKYERASFEERSALDEGASLLLDVTATPEMLDFDGSFNHEQDKENSFCEMET